MRVAGPGTPGEATAGVSPSAGPFRAPSGMHGMPSIRFLALGVFRDGTRILVGRGYDSVKRQHFHRPLGGAVEFGETAAEALRREIREELRAEIEEPVRLGVLENLFTWEGRPGHEVITVFDVAFADRSLYDRPSLPLHEDVWDGEAVWIDLSAPPAEPLYPDGLRALLRDAG